MPSLHDYLMDAQRLLREQRQDIINPDTLIAFINRARREVAMRAQCVRVLTPISAPCVSASVTTAGTGYTTATVTVSAPDFPPGSGANPGGAQATALPIVQNGTIAAVNITYGGDGYFQPTAVVTGPGSGATVTIETGPINKLVANQEVYPFSGVDLTGAPGAQSVYSVISISVIYANYRYSLPVYAFSVYQAKVRQYPFQYTYVPAVASQYGQGTSGSFYVYPLPSQTYQYELDCLCLPSPLTTNQSVEIIPEPWTDGVVYMTCHLAMNSIQNFNVGKYYLDLFEKMALGYSNYARRGRAVNIYGRY